MLTDASAPLARAAVRRSRQTRRSAAVVAEFALVAPILVPGGCLGALSAEFRGGETSEAVQAFTTIVAAHLATVLGTTAADTTEAKAAQA